MLSGETHNVQACTHALIGHGGRKGGGLDNNNDNNEETCGCCDCGDNTGFDDVVDRCHSRASAVRSYRACSRAFFAKIQQEELQMTEQDFKWSSMTTPTTPSPDKRPLMLFPDLNVKLVKELIGSGGTLAGIPLEETSVGYLTPTEWHQELSRLKASLSSYPPPAGSSSSGKDTATDGTILIDCRNTKEYEIGRFPGAIDPQTTTFNEFPKWVRDHKQMLADKKKVLMYCTGGIRCEKASAYIRREVPSVEAVHHLKGGIHKYLETYGDEGHWKGRNFVFDGRGAAGANETKLGASGAPGLEAEEAVAAPPIAKQTNLDGVDGAGEASSNSVVVVGRCTYCSEPYDSFDPNVVCTVCREPTLVCRTCQQSSLAEYHCRRHFHLRHCYFSCLEGFTERELRGQLAEISALRDEIAVGRKFKQKRKTLDKQRDGLKEELLRIERRQRDQHQTSTTTDGTACNSPKMKCRSCGDVECSGRCWGFYSLKRKERLEQQKKEVAMTAAPDDPSGLQKTRRQKQQQQQNSDTRPRRGAGGGVMDDVDRLNLGHPPGMFRDAATGIRVPPVVTRELRCAVKAKWCGRSLLEVVQKEFPELAKPETMLRALLHGLLRHNGKAVNGMMAASDVRLRHSDTISRLVHWHEAPVVVPPSIAVKKVALPEAILKEYDIIEDNEEAIVYVCNKPSTVPVHPAGPYLSNSLTVMLEAQENLPTGTLKPIHRTDRPTSGLVLCCTMPQVARIFHKCLSEEGGGAVQKLYLAKVAGKFPSSQEDFKEKTCSNDTIGKWCTWRQDLACAQVDAPVHTVNPANGFRTVDSRGKPSSTRFRLQKYYGPEDASLICCCPLSGRNHQIRVHLQWLGFPILNDVQYGGKVLPASKPPTPSSACHRQLDAFTDRSTFAISQMKEAANASFSLDHNRLESLTDADIADAKRGCLICVSNNSNDDGSNDDCGIRASFTPAQLLEKGHSIYLHALRYRVSLLPKKRKPNSSATTRQSAIDVLDLKVDPPEWADGSAIAEDIIATLHPPEPS